LPRAFLATTFVAMASSAVCLEETRARDGRGAAETKEVEKMRMERKRAAQRRRRIIMNNDGNDGRALDPGEEKTPETFLSKRISPLAGSQVAAIFYCTGVFSLGGISSGLGGSTTCRCTPASAARAREAKPIPASRYLPTRIGAGTSRRGTPGRREWTASTRSTASTPRACFFASWAVPPKNVIRFRS